MSLFSKSSKIFLFISALILLSLTFSLVFNYNFKKTEADNLSLDEQEATIRTINKVLPAVVSIIIYDQDGLTTLNLATGQKLQTTNKVKKGSGTGFLISSDGLILTNKHVVSVADEKSGEYKIILNSGKQYYAQLVGKDPLSDLAILKIFDKNLPYLEMGDSDKLQIGASVVAVGNVLGLYQNSVTKGIVSGLGRSVIAGDDDGNSESVDNAIQTDAEINFGNSGGPLVDLNGKVIGINVAKAVSGESIGFAIPINDARQVITSVKEIGRIKRPFLGVRYVMLTPELAAESGLKTEKGAFVIGGENELAIMKGSPADKAGLKEGDIITEINGIKIEGRNTLLSMMQKFKPGAKIGLRILRGSDIVIKTVTLEEYKNK